LSDARLLLTLKGECRSQGQDVVAEGTVKLMLRER
jgi:hypothetical protein